MRSNFTIAAILAAVVAYPAHAEICSTNAEWLVLVEKIVGNGYKPEQALPELGYRNIADGYWWNAPQMHCIYIPAAGPIAPVAVKATVCGLETRQKVGVAPVTGSISAACVPVPDYATFVADVDRKGLQ